MKRELKNLITLSSNVKVYVPSTTDINKEIDNSKYVDSTLKLLSEFFGGATSFNALGCWTSPSEGLVKEKVIVCESFCNEKDLNAHIESVIIFCENLKSEMKQDAIALEVNNKMYFV